MVFSFMVPLDFAIEKSNSRKLWEIIYVFFF